MIDLCVSMTTPTRTTEIQVLGKQIIDGRAIASTRTLEFVTVLALSGGEAHLSVLRNSLFGGCASKSAIANLAYRARGIGVDTTFDRYRDSYRLDDSVTVDLIELLRALRHGDHDLAIWLYDGPFLPTSKSPVAERMRETLSRRVRERIAEVDPELERRYQAPIRRPGRGGRPGGTPRIRDLRWRTCRSRLSHRRSRPPRTRWTEVACLIGTSSLARLWAGQSYGIDSMSMFAYLAGAGVPGPFVSSVSVTALTDARRAAVEAKSIAALTGRSFIHGIGAGSRSVRELVDGNRSRGSLDHLRRYHDVFRGEIDQSADDRTLSYPIPTPPVLFGLGVIRERAAALAGEIADAYITWMCGADHLADVLVPAIAASARAHHRPPPRGVAMVAVGVERAGRDPVAMAHLGVGGHVREPHYRDALHRAGIPVFDDYEKTIYSLLDQQIFLYGSAATIAHELFTRYAEAGIDEVALSLGPTASLYGMPEAIGDLAEIEHEYRKLATAESDGHEFAQI